MKGPVLFLACSAVLGGTVHALSLEAVLGRMERAETEVRGLRFDFTQTTRLTLTGESVRSEGSASFERPNRFRVEQRSPQRQTIVSDGKDLWFYSPSRGQVMRDSMQNWARSAGFPQGLTPFRMDVGEMRRKYAFALDSADPKTPTLKLSPVDTAALPYTLRVWVDMATGLPKKTELSSSSVTAMTEVRNARVNPAFTADTFSFRPPAGTDVIAPLDFSSKDHP